LSRNEMGLNRAMSKKKLLATREKGGQVGRGREGMSKKMEREEGCS